MSEEERVCPLCKEIEDDCCCIVDLWDEIERLKQKEANK